MNNSSPTLKPIRKTTVVNQAMDQLKELIASGQYKPGDKLPTESELAAQLGVGRSSIRETIKVFNYLGVLVSKSAKGTFVGSRSSISREALTWAMLLGQDDIDMLIDLRGAIELWCFLQLTIRQRETPEATKDVLADLDTILVAMDKALEANDASAVIQADFDFHKRIITSVSNELFADYYDTLRAFLFKEIEKSQGEYQDRSKILAEHQELAAAIRSGNIEQAASVYMAHIENIKNLLNRDEAANVQGNNDAAAKAAGDVRAGADVGADAATTAAGADANDADDGADANDADDGADANDVDDGADAKSGENAVSVSSAGDTPTQGCASKQGGASKASD